MESVIKPVFWTGRAKKDLDKIIRFNAKLYDLEKAIGIAYHIQKSTEILEIPNNNFMEIGAVDGDFAHLKYEYRKLLAVILP